jgi:hypothetical protein
LKYLFNILLVIIISICKIDDLYAQLGAIYYNGASSAGQVGFSNHKGSEAIFTNPAGMATSTTTFGANVHYIDQYGLGEISRIGLGGRYKSGLSHFGIGLYHYGIPEFKEQSLILSYARILFNNFRLAAQFNFNSLSIKINEQGNRVGNAAVNLGFQCDVNKSLMISGFIANALKISSNEYNSPPQIQVGFIYMPSEQVSLFVEAIKQTERPLSAVLGLNYSPYQQIQIRGSVDITKAEAGLAFFYSLSSYRIGASYGNHQNLGASYSVSAILD